MRLEVTRRADLATRALTALVEGDKLKAADRAHPLDASPGFLAQAMTPLVNQGWVRSEPGPTGGYRLAADPASLSVRHVIEAVEGTAPAQWVLGLQWHPERDFSSEESSRRIFAAFVAAAAKWAASARAADEPEKRRHVIDRQQSQRWLKDIERLFGRR